MAKIKSILTNKWLWLLLVLVAIGAGYYIYTQQQNQQEQFTTTNPERRTITQSLEVSGIVDADEKATLKFPATARLSWVGVEEGEWVEQWQAVATVDTRTLEKQLQQDFNTFEKSWRTHDQNIDNADFYSEAGITDEFKRIVESSGFDLQNSAINVEIRDLAIRLSSIVSPIDGLVVQIDQPNVGANITAADTFQVVNPDTMQFFSVVDEEDISLVQATQKVELVIDSYPEETIQALVQDIDFVPSQSESGGTGYGVTIAFPDTNQDLKYKLGMNGTATIIIDQKQNVLTIPVESLISRDDGDYVEVLVGEQTEQRPVTTGLESDDHIEITQGLTESDTVVVPNGSEE